MLLSVFLGFHLYLILRHRVKKADNHSKIIPDTIKFKIENNDLFIIPFMCIVCIAIPFVCVTLAPRYITAPEVNLFFLLETIIGPFWVWLVIKEQPSLETIQGGAVIILTIAIHSFLKLRKS